MESKLLLDTLLESLTLLYGECVGLGNNRNNIDNIRQLLEDNNVDGLQRVARWLDEEKAAVNAGVLDVALSLGSELLSQVGRVLVLDILDNGIPAAVVVDEIAVSWGVDNIQSQTDAILLNDVGDALDFSGGANGFIRL